MNLYLATLTELKQNLGIEDEKDDLILERAANGLQGRLESHCRRLFQYAAATVELHDGGVTWIELRRYPLDVLASVRVDNDQVFGVDTEEPLVDVRANYRLGLIMLGSADTKWPEGFQNVRAAFSGGLVASGAAAAPNADQADVDALRRAFFMQIEFEWRNRRSLGQQSVSQQGFSVNIAPADFLPEVKAALARLRRE